MNVSGNLARGRAAYASQIGTFGDMRAGRALDGYFTPHAYHCAHPLAQLVNVWWQVDLGDLYVINDVIIVNGHQTGGTYA